MFYDFGIDICTAGRENGLYRYRYRRSLFKVPFNKPAYITYYYCAQLLFILHGYLVAAIFTVYYYFIVKKIAEGITEGTLY